MRYRSARSPAVRLTSLLLATTAAACHLELDSPRGCDPEAACHALESVRPRAPTALSILTWNVEWFQHPERGQIDKGLELESVLAVIEHEDASLVALQEVSDVARFRDLVERLPAYASVVTNYDWPQQLALLYRPRELALVATQALVGLDDAGRPPLAVDLQHVTGARLRVVVVHAKAGATLGDYARRQRFAQGLSQQLACASEPSACIVLGDFNDRFTGSIVADRASPFEVLVAATGLAAATEALELGAERSTIWGDTVDHILVDARWISGLPEGSADILRDELLAENPHFVEEVSDHFPVRLRVADLAGRGRGPPGAD